MDRQAGLIANSYSSLPNSSVEVQDRLSQSGGGSEVHGVQGRVRFAVANAGQFGGAVGFFGEKVFLFAKQLLEKDVLAGARVAGGQAAEGEADALFDSGAGFLNSFFGKDAGRFDELAVVEKDKTLLGSDSGAAFDDADLTRGSVEGRRSEER